MVNTISWSDKEKQIFTAPANCLDYLRSIGLTITPRTLQLMSGALSTLLRSTMNNLQKTIGIEAFIKILSEPSVSSEIKKYVLEILLKKLIEHPSNRADILENILKSDFANKHILLSVLDRFFSTPNNSEMLLSTFFAINTRGTFATFESFRSDTINYLLKTNNSKILDNIYGRLNRIANDPNAVPGLKTQAASMIKLIAESKKSAETKSHVQVHRPPIASRKAEHKKPAPIYMIPRDFDQLIAKNRKHLSISGYQDNDQDVYFLIAETKSGKRYYTCLNKKPETTENEQGEEEFKVSPEQRAMEIEIEKLLDEKGGNCELAHTTVKPEWLKKGGISSLVMVLKNCTSAQLGALQFNGNLGNRFFGSISSYNNLNKQDLERLQSQLKIILDKRVGSEEYKPYEHIPQNEDFSQEKFEEILNRLQRMTEARLHKLNNNH